MDIAEKESSSNLIRYAFVFISAALVLILLPGAAARFASATVIAAGVGLLVRRGRRGRGITCDRAAAVIGALLFIWQLLCAYNIAFETGWDAGHIADAVKAYVCEYRNDMTSYYDYQSYPNNLLITFLEIFTLRVCRALGISTGLSPMPGMVLINCAVNTLACALVYMTAKLYVDEKYALCGYIAAVLLFGISPWTVIYYSDALCLAVPLACFYLYAKPVSGRARRRVRYAVCIVLGCVSYFIKPQCLIVLIAIFCCELIRTRSLRRFAALALAAVLAGLTFAGTQALIDAGRRSIGFSLDPERKYGAAHFLMMGLNEETGGVYSAEDVWYSSTFATAAERTAGNLEKCRERLDEFGAAGLARHLYRKMRIVYGYGTFAWGAEGAFYRAVPEPPNTSLSPLLRSVFYNSGSNYRYFSAFEQLLWAGVLLVSLFSAFCAGCRKKGSASALWLALLGIAAYELLFEARARYLYIYAPVFCTAAAAGLEACGGMLSGLWMRRKAHSGTK